MVEKEEEKKEVATTKGRREREREKKNYFPFFPSCSCFRRHRNPINLAQWLLHAMALAGEHPIKRERSFCFFLALRFSLLMEKKKKKVTKQQAVLAIFRLFSLFLSLSLLSLSNS